MRRTLVPALAASVALTFAVAGGAAPLAATPELPAGWSHAEINVIIKHVPHTLIYDRGRVQAVSASSLTLREAGRAVTVPVSANAQVTIAGQPSSLSQVRRLEVATTVSIDGDPATTVSVRIPPAVAAAIARQQARLAAQQARIAAREARRQARTGTTA